MLLILSAPRICSIPNNCQQLGFPFLFPVHSCVASPKPMDVFYCNYCTILLPEIIKNCNRSVINKRISKIVGTCNLLIWWVKNGDFQEWEFWKHTFFELSFKKPHIEKIKSRFQKKRLGFEWFCICKMSESELALLKNDVKILTSCITQLSERMKAIEQMLITSSINTTPAISLINNSIGNDKLRKRSIISTDELVNELNSVPSLTVIDLKKKDSLFTSTSIITLHFIFNFKKIAILCFSPGLY